MLKRFVLAFAILGLAVASAETYRVTLSQPSTVKGKQLKAGDYRLNLENSKLTIVNGKESVEVPVTVQTGTTKFETTAVRYTGTGDKVSLKEIRIGGTKTSLLFEEQSGL
jgi:alkyl sulfatase BDS1-like metallo-beta-lactamase superfamily hydrolase